MGWKGVTVMDQRVRFIAEYLKGYFPSDEAIPCILEPQGDVKTFRKNWARLIQKIYEVNHLICPKCKGSMRIISLCEAIAYVK